MATASAKQGDEEVDGDRDADGDGRTNREEHDAQTDPTDPGVRAGSAAPTPARSYRSIIVTSNDASSMPSNACRSPFGR